MSSIVESMWNHADIDVPLDRIKPTGDCVLVRVLPEEEVTASGIVLPQMGKDSAELRIGEVVASGPGDRAHQWQCKLCFRETTSTTKAPKHIAHCIKGREHHWVYRHHDHHHMHVKPGDRIWYRRVLANQQLINGELYQIIREEQHIWAVLEN